MVQPGKVCFGFASQGCWLPGWAWFGGVAFLGGRRGKETEVGRRETGVGIRKYDWRYVSEETMRGAAR